MEIIKFEDGQLIKPAYITIDGVEYEVTPSVYQGNTPLSSYNLNKMQENILKEQQKNIITAGLNANQVISSTNAEKITLDKKTQKGDNLSLSNGGIKIGKGITHIKVSAEVFYTDGVNSGDNLILYINKNQDRAVNVQQKVMGVTTLIAGVKLLEVQEGDIIYLYTRNNATEGAIVSLHSFLTVEAV